MCVAWNKLITPSYPFQINDGFNFQREIAIVCLSYGEQKALAKSVRESFAAMAFTAGKKAPRLVSRDCRLNRDVIELSLSSDLK